VVSLPFPAVVALRRASTTCAVAAVAVAASGRRRHHRDDFRQDAIGSQSLVVSLGDLEPQLRANRGDPGLVRLVHGPKGLGFGSPGDLDQDTGDLFAGVGLVVVDQDLPLVVILVVLLLVFLVVLMVLVLSVVVAMCSVVDLRHRAIRDGSSSEGHRGSQRCCCC
jgi:hypothetical protein